MAIYEYLLSFIFMSIFVVVLSPFQIKGFNYSMDCPGNICIVRDTLQLLFVSDSCKD